MSVDSSIHFWCFLLIHFLREKRRLPVKFLKASKLTALQNWKLIGYKKLHKCKTQTTMSKRSFPYYLEVFTLLQGFLVSSSVI